MAIRATVLPYDRQLPVATHGFEIRMELLTTFASGA
jgi:hypothetical protein